MKTSVGEGVPALCVIRGHEPSDDSGLKVSVVRRSAAAEEPVLSRGGHRVKLIHRMLQPIREITRQLQAADVARQSFEFDGKPLAQLVEGPAFHYAGRIGLAAWRDRLDAFEKFRRA